MTSRPPLPPGSILLSDLLRRMALELGMKKTLHPEFKIDGTQTGRLSVPCPNLSEADAAAGMRHFVADSLKAEFPDHVGELTGAEHAAFDRFNASASLAFAHEDEVQRTVHALATRQAELVKQMILDKNVVSAMIAARLGHTEFHIDDTRRIFAKVAAPPEG